jgi:hypothetical protein
MKAAEVRDRRGARNIPPKAGRHETSEAFTESRLGSGCASGIELSVSFRMWIFGYV